MSLFKVLRGPSSRISAQTFHDGYAYHTPDDRGFYIDSEVNGTQKRIRINKREVFSATQPAGLEIGDDWEQTL